MNPEYKVLYSLLLPRLGSVTFCKHLHTRIQMGTSVYVLSPVYSKGNAE